MDSYANGQTLGGLGGLVPTRQYGGLSSSPLTPNRPIDSSPIGQALAALEESGRCLHGAIDRHAMRLDLILHQAPPTGDGGATKMQEPISVLDRIAAADSIVRIASARLEALTERLLL